MADTEPTSIQDVVVAMVRERGFALPERPEADAIMPPDVTVISGDALMRLMGVYTALVAYASTEEAIAAGRARSMASRYKQARAQQYINFKSDFSEGGKITEKHLDYELDADEELAGYRKEEILSENYARLVRSLLSGFEAKYQLLSRELTRRGLAGERHFD
jgi:hypothetical protein